LKAGTTSRRSPRGAPAWVGAAAEDLQLAATGRAHAVDGTVSISATEVVGACLLPAVLSRLRRDAPGIVVEVVPTDAISDLRRHGHPRTAAAAAGLDFVGSDRTGGA
jgi:DNA-binding transcriptional LysR family regulator